MYECYDKVIGLAKDDCVCMAEGRPEDYTTSKSGLHLSDLELIPSVIKLDICDKDVWNHKEESVELAIKKFVADTNAMISKDTKLKRNPLKKQVIGQMKLKDVAASSKNYAYMRINPIEIRGGYAKVSKFGGLFEADGIVHLYLVDNYGNSYWDGELATVANRHSTVDVNLTLEFKIDQPDVEYILYYLWNDDNRPKDTKALCPTCGNYQPQFDVLKHYSERVNNRRANWANWFMIAGGTVNSISEFEDLPDNATNRVYGLTMEVTTGCRIGEVVCEDSLDFEGNPLAISIAFAIQYKAGALFAGKVLTMPSFASIVNAEEWEDKIIEWNSLYSQNVAYIAEQVDTTVNDCLSCHDVEGMTREGIFS